MKQTILSLLVLGFVGASVGAQENIRLRFELYKNGTEIAAPTIAVQDKETGSLNYLANILDSPVHDETGLRGSYDFRLEVLAPTGETLSPFTIVQEQLGLKLEATKAPVEVLVIDHAERPTPN
jgi:uncharacterized protein (TIGR03435 family)